jgi:hypothetical protein
MQLMARSRFMTVSGFSFAGWGGILCLPVQWRNIPFSWRRTRELKRRKSMFPMKIEPFPHPMRRRVSMEKGFFWQQAM